MYGHKRYIKVLSATVVIHVVEDQICAIADVWL